MDQNVIQKIQLEGYKEDFLGEGLRVSLPALSPEQIRNAAPVEGREDKLVNYLHYSLIQDSARRFPYFTASNISGSRFVDLSRKDIFFGGSDRWRRDPRLSKDHQWGAELYNAEKSVFDRGHMTRREDVQWGDSNEQARAAAETTFYYTNSVPQHPDLNRAIWSDLEDYILQRQTIVSQLQVNLFTGPVLRPDDPQFITPVKGERVQIPILFWKVVFFTRGDGRLYRVGFLMGQRGLLEKAGVIEPAPIPREAVITPIPKELLFLQFAKADTYQVKVSAIEKLTGMRFARAKDPLSRRKPVLLEQVEVPAGERSLGGGVEIKGLSL